MPKSAADYAHQSDPQRNPNFSRRWIEPVLHTDLGTSRLGSQRVRPIDAMIQHSADRSRHVLAGRMVEGLR